MVLRGVRMAHSGGSSRDPEQSQGMDSPYSEVCREYYGCDQLWGGKKPGAAGETTGFLSVILESCNAARPQSLLVSGRESPDKNSILPYQLRALKDGGPGQAWLSDSLNT